MMNQAGLIKVGSAARPTTETTRMAQRADIKAECLPCADERRVRGEAEVSHTALKEDRAAVRSQG